MSNFLYCQECGTKHEKSTSVKFCSNCGFSFYKTQAKVMPPVKQTFVSVEDEDNEDFQAPEIDKWDFKIDGLSPAKGEDIKNLMGTSKEKPVRDRSLKP